MRVLGLGFGVLGLRDRLWVLQGLGFRLGTLGFWFDRYKHIFHRGRLGLSMN